MILKTIKVGKVCRITNTNPTPSKKNVDIAINITALDTSSGFINFVLSMDNHYQCCENYDAEFEKNFDGDTHFVDEIVIYANETSTSSGGEDNDIIVNCYHNYRLIASGVCSNEHNGFYYHTVYLDHNGEVHTELV